MCALQFKMPGVAGRRNTRMSISWGKTHPAFVKNGATTPRNYAPTRYTSEDAHDYYTHLAMRQGKTVGDILHECLKARRIKQLLDGK